VYARVTADPGAEGLVVEKAAVQVLGDEQVVFVADGPGRFKPVEVVTGDSNSRYIRVLSGLDLGTEYVAAGAFELKAKIVTSSLGGHAGHGH
jgi:cobalt-zinc-cadmium efflux system membrane fusion protein